MDPTESPLRRSIGFSGIVRWIIVVFAVMAVAEAFAQHRYGLAVAGLAFFAFAGALAYRLRRSGRGAA